ncbi:MAG: magnesium-translocating P-type ATPase [Patescibacteria group bacterium]|nr:magnesium-translocating P-type ATPase [Patescibacteria group bacterium]
MISNFNELKDPTLPLSDILAKLETKENGLTIEEAKKRLLQYGSNQIVSQNEKGVILKFLSKFTSPLIVMLISIAILSYFFGEKINSMIILLMALLSGVLSFIQEYHASESAKKLNAMVKIVVRVWRSGQKKDIPLAEIVPGDVVELTSGKMIPADLRIISSQNLFINQAVLNGEAFPAKKNPSQGFKKAESLWDNDNLAFMGSNIASGTGTGLVLQTGKNTEFGKLSHEVTKIGGQTSFEKGINNFSWLMIKFTFVLVIIIFIINAIFKGNILDSLLFSLAIAVALTPEMLPMIVAINLSKGAIDMAKKKVIVKELRAIQNFGAMDILCTDKTGTLTINEIVLIKHCDPQGKESDELLRLAYLSSHFQEGSENLFDRAIQNHKKFDSSNCRKIYEIPFDFSRRLSSIVLKIDAKKQLISKGAPEEIFSRSNKYLVNDKISPLTTEVKNDLQKLYDDYSRDGFRVLGLGFKEVEEKSDYSVTDEKDLTFVGFVAFLDPPKPTAKDAIELLNSYKIDLKILSGDNELVTRKICSEVGIKISNVLSGEMIEKLNDLQLQAEIEKVNVLIRLSPMQKKRVIEVLRNQHTVGFLGDGINDAPALRAADVGISVDNAFDVAKETAEIILLEKDLSILGNCVVEGRKTFANIIKYIKVGSSSNFGNMLSMSGASIFLPFLPALPSQLLLNNFLYDVSQVALPTDNVDTDYLIQPRPWDIKYIKEFMLFVGPVSSIFDFTTFGVMWYVFHASPELFRTGWFVESLCTQILVIFIIRTKKIPFIQSRPSKTLIYTTLSIVLLTSFLPYSPVARYFGFEPLPILFFGFLLGIVVLNMLLTQIVKNWFIKKFGFE